MFSKATIVKSAKTALVAIGIGVAAYISTAPASAITDTALDKRFVQMVTDLGINVTASNKDSMVDVAHNVCSALGSNESPDAIASDLAQENAITTKQAKGFIVAAETVYCPQHLPG
jgi:hypothetical protein